MRYAAVTPRSTSLHLPTYPPSSWPAPSPPYPPPPPPTAPPHPPQPPQPPTPQTLMPTPSPCQGRLHGETPATSAALRHAPLPLPALGSLASAASPLQRRLSFSRVAAERGTAAGQRALGYIHMGHTQAGDIRLQPGLQPLLRRVAAGLAAPQRGSHALARRGPSGRHLALLRPTRLPRARPPAWTREERPRRVGTEGGQAGARRQEEGM